MTTYKVVTPELKRQNNPAGLPVGAFTGRCPKCESTNLWDDNLAYGCDCCGWSSVLGRLEVVMSRNKREGYYRGVVWVICVYLGDGRVSKMIKRHIRDKEKQYSLRGN